MRFDLDSYETVEARLERFWTEHPNGRIQTQLLSKPDQLDEAVMFAAVWFDIDDAHPRATGIAFETRGGPGANATSHVENCETSALGRALANCGFKARRDAPRPSREEMKKVERGGQGDPQPQQRTHDRQPPGGTDCPDCGAPAGKPHASKCPRKGGQP